VPEPLPDALVSAMARIEPPPPAQQPAPPDVTGTLADLLQWWTSVSDGRAPAVAVLEPPQATAEADTALLDGLVASERAIDAGATLLVPRAGGRDDHEARAIVALLTRGDAGTVTYQGPAVTDRAWMNTCAEIRASIERVADLRSDPLGLLAALDARHIAYLVGVLLGGAARRTPSVVEGTGELGAALMADRLCFRAKDWWRAGSTSTDPARVAAVDRLALAPGLPLGLTDDTGRGADATIALLGLLTV